MTSQTNAITHTLRTLHRIHRQLSDLKERLERGPRVVRAHEANVERLRSQLAGLEEETSTLRKATDEKQDQLARTEANLRKRRTQLRQATSNAEYQALKDDIEATEMANSVLEDEILEALEKLDGLNEQVDRTKTAVAGAQEEADKVRQQIQQQGPRIRNDLERLGAELKQCEASLTGDFRDLYRRIVPQKGEDALAAVEGEFCGGCNQHVPVNLINELLLNRPAACKACGRLLYLPEDYAPG
jgi:predicted  nucleic acid-binding Zn-ribbon protein